MPGYGHTFSLILHQCDTVNASQDQLCLHPCLLYTAHHLHMSIQFLFVSSPLSIYYAFHSKYRIRYFFVPTKRTISSNACIIILIEIGREKNIRILKKIPNRRISVIELLQCHRHTALNLSCFPMMYVFFIASY